MKKHTPEIIAVEVQGRSLGSIGKRTPNRRWRASGLHFGSTFEPGLSTSFIQGMRCSYSAHEWRYRGLMRVSRLWTYVPIVEPSPEFIAAIAKVTP